MKKIDLQFVPVSTADEIETLHGVADAIWHEYYAELLSRPQIDYMVGKFQSPQAIASQIAEQHFEYYLLKSDDRFVGYVGIQPQGDRLFLSKLYLYRHERGNGFGNRVFAFLDETCRQRGLGAIWMTVNRHNDNTVAIYRKKGFEVVRTQVVDIGQGFVMDDFVMEKRIGTV